MELESYDIFPASISEADEIMRIINDAYSVETGNEGIAFKTAPRLRNPTEGLIDAYNEGRILKAVGSQSASISAIIIYEIHEDFIYFGPFAVLPTLKGKGLGKAMIEKLKEIGKEKGKSAFEIRVINHRTDILPMYLKWGYEIIGEEPYPFPQNLSRPAYFFRLRKSFSD